MAPTICKVALGNNHTLFLDSVGQVYGTGSNKYGQLDSHVDTNFSTPMAINSLRNAIHIAASSKASHIICTSFILKGCGDNSEFGVGYPSPIKNAAGRIHSKGYLTSVTLLAREHAIEITKEGAIKFSGRNTHGQLGSKKGKLYAGLLRENKEFKGSRFHSGSTGPYHTLLVTLDGSLYASGENKDLQLGYMSVQKRETTCFGFIPVPFSVKITFAAVGRCHSVVLDENGDVWTAGNNQFGQLGRLSSETGNLFQKVDCGVKFLEISAGYDHTLLLDRINRLWGAGSNNEGQLGLEDKPEQLVFGIIDLGRPISSIAAGSHASFVISEGRAMATGANDCGQLGLGDFISRNTFTELPSFTIDPLRSFSTLKDVTAKQTSAATTTNNISSSPFFSCATKPAELPFSTVNKSFTTACSRFKIVNSPSSYSNRTKRTTNSSLAADTHKDLYEIVYSMVQRAHSEQVLPPRQLEHRLNPGESPRLSNSSKILKSSRPEPLSVHQIHRLCKLAGLNELVTNQIMLVHDTARGSPLNNNQIIKNMFLQHRLPMARWNDVVQLISTRIAKLSKPTESDITVFEQNQEGLKKLRTLVEPIARVEDEIRSCFPTTLSGIERITEDDVQVFLCIARITDLADSFRKMNIDGKMLSQFATGILDYRGFKDDTWSSKNCCRLQYALDLLKDGVFMSPDHEANCKACTANLDQLLSDLPLSKNCQNANIGVKEFLGMKNVQDLCMIFGIDMRKDRELMKLVISIRERLLRQHNRYIQSYKHR